MDIAVKQFASKARDRENYWNWSVWIDASKEVIEQINYVEYILHSSFPNRVRTRSSKRDHFKLSSKGWGEFTIFVRIYMHDSTEPSLYSHNLKLFDQEKKENNKLVFISSTLINNDKVEELTKELKQIKVKVKSQSTIDAGSNFSDSINKSIQESDTFILYGGVDDITRNQQYELDLAIKAEKRIIIVSDHEIENLNLGSSISKTENDIRIVSSKDDIIKNI